MVSQSISELRARMGGRITQSWVFSLTKKLKHAAEMNVLQPPQEVRRSHTWAVDIRKLCQVCSEMPVKGSLFAFCQPLTSFPWSGKMKRWEGRRAEHCQLTVRRPLPFRSCLHWASFALQTSQRSRFLTPATSPVPSVSVWETLHRSKPPSQWWAGLYERGTFTQTF